MSPNDSTVIAQCTEYSIESFGGTEVLVAALIRGLSARHKIVLVSDDDRNAIEHSEFSSLLAAHIPWRPENASPAAAQNLARQLCSYDVGLAHFHFGGNFGWGNRRLNRCPLLNVQDAGIRCVSTNHGAFALLDGYCASWRPLWIKLALLPAAWAGKMQVLQHVEAEIAVSRNDLRNLQTWYWPVRGKFRQIYHSRIGENFPPRSNQTRRKVILCVGTVGPRKGQTFLVEAFVQLAAKVPDWQLVLIGREGDATMADRIHELIASNRLEGQIQLLGARNDQEVCKWMEQSEIFAMPSVQEGLGLSLQEALFRGCACVGSRVGGIPELIEDGVNGLLVPAGNVRELANALERLIEDNHLRRAVSDRGSLSILQKKMTAEEMISRYRALYQEILQR